MAKAVLISIRPEWVEKILAGEKKMEVRKTRPNMVTPFKCYIYCTNSGVAMGMWGKHGKVIGEFTCNKVTNLFSNSRFWLDGDYVLQTCLSAAEIRKYANGANGLYGWHISKLEIYDDPKQLNRFKRWNRECKYNDLGFAIPNCGTCQDCIVKKPPQSWCYVEELK